LAKLDPVTGARAPFASAPRHVRVLTVAGNTLYAGRMEDFNSDPLAAYDLGSGTEVVWDSGLSCDVYALAVVGSSLWAGGCAGLARYNLADRTRAAAPIANGFVGAFADDGAGGVWVGGLFEQLGGTPTRYLGHVGANGQ